MGGTLKASPTHKQIRPSAKGAAAAQKAKARRSNPPNTQFRKYFERGDLPFIVEHGSSGIRPAWKTEASKLDYHHYLPVFFDGLREKEEPFSTMALQGCLDLLRVGGSKILPVVPQLILPIKSKFMSRCMPCPMHYNRLSQLRSTHGTLSSCDGQCYRCKS